MTGTWIWWSSIQLGISSSQIDEYIYIYIRGVLSTTNQISTSNCSLHCVISRWYSQGNCMELLFNRYFVQSERYTCSVMYVIVCCPSKCPKKGYSMRHYWLVVWNIFYFPIYWEVPHPNWRTHIFQRGFVNRQPDINHHLITINHY